MLTPATRPCLLAWVPSATTTRWPETRCTDSTQSPAAHTPSTAVRIRTSTAMPPEVPSGMPASCARRTFGRTPSPRTTRSAGSSRPEDDGGGGRPRAARGDARRGAAVRADVDGGRAVREDQLDPLAAHGVGEEFPDIGVEGADRRRRQVHDRDLQAAHPAGLGDLQADVAATDHDDAAYPAGAELGPQRGAVVEHLDAVDPGGLDTRHRRPHRHAAGGVDQVVEGLGALAAGIQ